MPVDTSEPTWAGDATYTSGPRSGELTKLDAPDPDQGFVPGEGAAANVLNRILNKIALWLADTGRGVYGDGSDGNVTIGVGTTTLTRDMYYDNLTVTGTLATAGFRVFVRGTCTINVGGIISSDGNPGGDGTTGSVAGGAVRNQGTLGATEPGGAGGDENPATAGTAGDNAANSLGGAGGAGANGFGGALGAAGGTITAPTAADGTCRTLYDAIRGRNLAGTRFLGGAGGGGGGGGSSAGDGGGGGGAGGGFLVLVAYLLVNNGTIRALGGDGGDGGIAAQFGGGGGGGGGGVVVTVARGRSGSGTISVAGGAAGSSGVGPAATAGSVGTQIALAA